MHTVTAADPTTDRSLRDRIAVIDSLRGIAVLMVMFYHAAAWVPGLENIGPYHPLQLLKFGFSGVDLFFVLSGFSLYYAWLREQGKTGSVSVGRYYLRRFWRIYPPYLLAILLPLIPGFLSSPEEAVTELLWFVPMLQNFSIDHFYGSNGPMWSLAVEAQFYAVLPLIVLGFRRFGVARLTAGLIIACVLYRGAVYLEFSDLTYRQVAKPYLQGLLLSRVPNFVLGMGMAALFTGNIRTFFMLPETSGERRAVLYALAGVAVIGLTWISIYAFRHTSMIWRELGFAAGYSLLVLGLLGSEILQKKLNNRFLLFSGVICYSLYLTHAPLLMLLRNAVIDVYVSDTPIEWFLETVALLSVCFVGAWVFYRLIEIPSMARSRTYRV